MKLDTKRTASIIGNVFLCCTLISCGVAKKVNSSGKHDQAEATRNDQGSASFSLADLQSLGDVKRVQLVVTGTDAKGTPYTRALDESYVAGKKLKMENLPNGNFKVSLKVLDATGKVIATAGADNVAIAAGAETKLNLTLTKAGDPGSVVVDVMPPPAPAPKVANKGYDIHGNFKTCPILPEQTACAALLFMPVLPSKSDTLWEQRCEKEGHTLLFCTDDPCGFAIPYDGTKICSGKITPPDTFEPPKIGLDPVPVTPIVKK